MELRTKVPNAFAGEGLFKPVVGYRRYLIGVDLAALQDRTAISVIEDELKPAPRYGKGFVQEFEPRRQTLVQAVRLPIGLEWPAICDTIKKVKDQIPDSELFVDLSGLGQPVGSMLKERGVSFTGVTITSGDTFKKVNHTSYRCSKSYLISFLATLFQSGDLRISDGITDAKEFRQQVEDFVATTTPAGNVSFQTREGRHDDLLLATAIAAFGVAQSQTSTFKASALNWG